jgi:hypothetical protein
LSTNKIFRPLNNFTTFIKSKNRIRMEEKMRKTDSMLGLFGAEVNVNIAVTANVKIDKGGGGGSNM